MRKLILFLAAVIAVITAGCAAPQLCTPYEGKKVKTAYFVDNGCHGGGVIHIARLLSYSPQVDITLIDGKDLREKKLDDFDLIVMPGGSSASQMRSMKPEGVEILRDFVRNGGSYLGICAGCHITLNRPERAAIMPYRYDREAVGWRADVFIDIADKGTKILDIPAGRYYVRYSRGPILKEDKWEHGSCETLATYQSSVGPVNRVGRSFYGTPAMIYGNFGKGKAIATSFHPEYNMNTWIIFQGCFYAVTGVKLTPALPVNNYRPLRVSYYFEGAQKKDRKAMLREYLALEKEPELGVQLGLSMEICSNVDAVILADANENHWKEFTKVQNDAIITDFMNRGGKVIAVGASWDKIPDHKNLIRLKQGDSAVDAALAIANL